MWALATHTLTVTATGSGSVTPAGTSTHDEGSEVTLTAIWTDATHYFHSWGGACSGMEGATCTLTQFDNDATVSATFAERCTAGATDPTCIRVVYIGAPDDYANVTDIPANFTFTPNSEGRYQVGRGEQITVVTGGASLPAGYTRFYLQRAPLTTSPSPVSASQLIPPVGTTYTFTPTTDPEGAALITFDLTAARPHPVRPTHKPEHLLKGSLLIALFSVRSERQFCEQLRYNLLFKWFLDLNVEDEPFNATTFSKNRERLLEAEVARAFFSEVVGEAGRRRLLSDDHFSVDGPLLEAWASLKSYRPRDEQEPPSSSGGRNAEVDFRGQHRSRETHVSRTDAEARLYRKGPQQEAKLSYLGHVLSENRHGLVVDVELSEANGYGEREAALQMLERSVRGRATLGADRAYDTRDFVAAVRARGVTPHVARNDRGRRSAIDGRTTRHAGYGRSLRRRKRWWRRSSAG